MGQISKNWRDYIEAHTGEVSASVVAECLGVPVEDVMEYVKTRHGARFVGGVSVNLIWKEDAATFEEQNGKK